MASFPMAPSEQHRFQQCMVLVEFLQKLLSALDVAKEDEEKKSEVYDRTRAAALDMDVQIDRARHGRKIAQNRLNLWMQNRPKFLGLPGMIGPGKRKQEELQEDVRWKDDLVQTGKGASERLHAFSKEAHRVLLRVQALLKELKRDLAVAAVELRSRNARMFEEFTRCLSLRERIMLDEAMPKSNDSILEADEGQAGADEKTGGSDTQKGVSSTNKPVPRILPELGKLKR